jgi:tricorn protease
MGAIHAYSIADSTAAQITDGLSDAKYLVFDKEGKYLYFAASTDSGQALGSGVLAGKPTHF